MQHVFAQVFAYGQTGSGKTYTMGTAASVKEVSGKGEATGVIPRSIKSVFATMQQARADYDVNMKVCRCCTLPSVLSNCLLANTFC